ncbi:tripartite tricarboxylate transporter TctB family protein [Pararhizobium sp. IMCC21322]|uniref:tripartite tricarboxylate transporter TctB family protein n=1 Tax=Pararhizobium sp. IMCC21322 TaxID=3067903 RepID=UPI0027425965|nr:tripartite tricarboxylate transporter TctB family protein [Pararhizobium sp. IMCC21322]
MKTQLNPDRRARWLVPICIILFCLVALYFTTTFKKMPPILKRGIQPSDFPQLVCLLIVSLTLLMVWKDPVKIVERVTSKSWMTMGLMIGFVALMQVDLFLALGAFAATLTMLWGERRPRNIALVGLLIPTSVFFLFDLVFKIRFPRGLLTSLWYG